MIDRFVFQTVDSYFFPTEIALSFSQIDEKSLSTSIHYSCGGLSGKLECAFDRANLFQLERALKRMVVDTPEIFLLTDDDEMIEIIFSRGEPGMGPKIGLNYFLPSHRIDELTACLKIAPFQTKSDLWAFIEFLNNVR